jgi:dienelactone hydrolase
MALDTVKQRFDRLKPHLQAYGTNDSVRRPAVIFFHGCGGIAPNLLIYAKAAVEAGARVFIVDSFTPRGWSRKHASAWVCKGLKLRGYERSGDVLAAVAGIRQFPEVDEDRVVLAGWSHGAWAIMDLMTQTLDKAGDARLADPSPKPLDGVKGLFLSYPYINVMARSVTRPWQHKPRTLAVLSLADHLATYNQSVKLIEKLRKQGVDATTVTVNATHAFDEEGIDRTGIMKYDAEAAEIVLAALKEFMAETLA